MIKIDTVDADGIANFIRLVLFILAIPLSSNLSNNQEAIIMASGAILTSIVIFYPLIYQKSIEKKVEGIITKKWNDTQSFIGQKLSSINQKIEQSRVDLAKNEIEDILGELDDTTTYFDSINAKKAVLWAFFCLLFSILVGVIDKISPLHIEMSSGRFFITAYITLVLLLFGVFYAIKLVLIWHHVAKGTNSV